jgi:hypothetical protein
VAVFRAFSTPNPAAARRMRMVPLLAAWIILPVQSKL